MDSSGSDRPPRRKALVGRELDRYKVETAALSETRLAEEGLLKDVGAGYTFFWSGRKKEERRKEGVGFAIKSHLVSKLSGLPKGINDRLMTLRLPLSGKRHFVHSVLLVLRLSRLGKRELILVLFVRLFGLCLLRFVGFLFLLVSG